MKMQVQINHNHITNIYFQAPEASMKSKGDQFVQRAKRGNP